jgi:hypothetical protein
LESRAIRFAELPFGFAYEQIKRLGDDEVTRFERLMRETLGERYERSQLPRFFRGFRQAIDAVDWVDQSIAARRAVEDEFGVLLDDRRVSRLWWTPLLADMLLSAERFVRAYNDALAQYRSENRVRAANRPIPDLVSNEGAYELPVWAYRAPEARRRLFVTQRGDDLVLFGDDAEIGRVCVKGLEDCEAVGVLLGETGWQLRPRALTLTIWARLMLADLFIHGVGGAKYDRISDALITDYYGLEAPEFACVSATLWMDLPHEDTTVGTVREARRRLRDLQWNPQRHLDLDGDLQSLAQRRAEAVGLSRRIRESDAKNRSARRGAFEEIRHASERMHAACPRALDAARAELDRCVDRLEQSAIARGREYFFALYDRPQLCKLLDALPDVSAFRA